MKNFRADLHIHTVLSPCGDLEMSPVNIIERALEMRLDIIGITDHNSTRQCTMVRQLGALKGISVLMGVEVNTKEEVHCLAFFENTGQLEKFQQFLDASLPDIQNDPDRFGYQLVVDNDDNILFQEDRLLISALLAGIDETEAKVHELQGLFIPAHADKSRNSIISQLGFVPPQLQLDAIEFSPFSNQALFILQHPELGNYPLISSSDAHYLSQIGSRVTMFGLARPDFCEIKALLHGKWTEKIKVVS